MASEHPTHAASVAQRAKQRRRGKGGDGLGALIWARLARGARRQAVFVLVFATLFSAAGLWFHTSAGAAVTVPAGVIYIGLGVSAALLLGFLRELARNTVTSVSSLGKNRSYTVLGAAPELSLRMLRQLPPDQRSPLGCVTYEPASPFATAFRDVQGQILADGVVAFIGTGPGEGATTSALCAAASATQQGRSVVIVDCDLRRRSLTRGFGLAPELGVLEACERPEFWRDYVEEEHETGLHFLPAAKPHSPWRTLVGQAGFPALLKQLRDAYELVVLDCPPALGAAEGPVLARLAQRCVLVATWDQTPLGAVRQAIRALRAKPGAVSVFVNRVPPGYRFGRLRPD